MWHWLETGLRVYLLHPLTGRGYQFWSGIAGSFVVGGSLWAGTFAFWRHHNCHVKGCWRMGRHAVADTPFRVCRIHHPDVPDGGATAEHIEAAHAAAKEKP